LLGDPVEAEDIVQDTFVKALSNLLLSEGRSSVGTWFYRIACNASMDGPRLKNDYPLPEQDAVEEEELPAPMPRRLVEWNTSEINPISTEDKAALDVAIRIKRPSCYTGKAGYKAFPSGVGACCLNVSKPR
jgi:RNA polymerase sigma-70 factor (ECF subfamily)